VARTDADLLEGLADALAGSATEAEALATFAQGGMRAERVARALEEARRRGEGVLSAIARAAGLSGPEGAMLAAVGREAATTPTVVAALRAVAARARTRARRRGELAVALVSPIALSVLGIALAPLPNLVLGDAYFGPVLRELGLFALATGALVIGVPWLLGHRTAGPRLLELLAATPLLGRLARAHVEAEVATALAPFADGTSIDPAGLAAAATVATYGPLAVALHPSRASLRSLGEHASEGLRLLLATAPRAGRLDVRLARFADDASDRALRAQRRALVAAAWIVVLATSVPMLARGLSGGLGVGGTGGLRGVMELQNAEERELEKLMNEPR
jgi:hypothetical protein